MPTMRPNLTEEQKLAATCSDGRVYIEASPGSGKTTVAAERFGVARFGGFTGGPGVLALSFARSARGELHDRIRRRWGTNAMRWPHRVSTLDQLHLSIVRHLLVAGHLVWPGGHDHLEVLDSWRGHQSRWLEEDTFRRVLTISDGLVAHASQKGPATYGYTQIAPFRARIDAGRCTHQEIRQVLAAAIAPGSPLRPTVGEFLLGTISALIVDEVFDGNPLDLAIVRGAARRNIPTTLIGDPWQALYKFRGATPGHVPAVVASLAFAPYPMPESHRFETPEMRVLAEKLRSGDAVALAGGGASDCDVVLASEWSRLWQCSDDVLPHSFGQPANRVDAAIAILLDHIVSQHSQGPSTFVADAASLLGIDVTALHQDASAKLGPVVEILSAGTPNAAEMALDLLRTTLTEMGSVNITNLAAAAMQERHERLRAIARRLSRPKLVPGLTVHQAKGREWNNVGISLSEAETGRLGTGLSHTKELDRTVYVGLTRARRTTVVV